MLETDHCHVPIKATHQVLEKRFVPGTNSKTSLQIHLPSPADVCWSDWCPAK